MSLKNKTKKVIYFLTVAIFLFCGSVMVNSTTTKYAQLERERVSLLNAPTTEEETRQRLTAVEHDLESTELRLVQYRPPQTDMLVPAFIQHVETLAKDEGVVISTISPIPKVKGFPLIESPFPIELSGKFTAVHLTKSPFQVELSGEFTAIHRFLSRLEKSVLPIRIESMEMMLGEEKNLDVSLVTYILYEEGSQKKPLPPGEAIRTVFTSEPYESTKHALALKRDIFFYPRAKIHTKRLKKKIFKKKSKKYQPQNLIRKARLSAVIYDKSESMVLLNDVFLSVGDLYKGYTVMSIEKDQVFLMNKKNRHKVVIKAYEG